MTTRATIGKRMICFLLAILMIFSQMPTGIISAEAETTYSVTIDSTIQNGTVTVSPASSAAEETVTLTVTPDEGYAVSAVNVTTDAAQTETAVTRQEDGTYTFTMPAENVTVTAAFKQTYAVNIAGDIANGTVTADQTAASEGDTVTLTVSPEEGFIVSQVKANENEVTADGEGVYTFTMPAENVTVTAAFVEVPLMLSGTNNAFTGWTQITGTTTIRSNGNYYLDSNVTGRITVNSGITATLDLNGYVLKGTGGIVITNNGTLTIQDSNTDNQTHYYTVGEGGLWAWNDSNMQNAVSYEDLTARPEINSVVAVKGGAITGGSGSTSGAGVRNNAGSTFTLQGGNIIGNTTNKNAGGVYGLSATISITDGAIIGNCQKGTTYGGAGMLLETSTCTMSAGDISFNTASYNGGGVYNYNSTAFTMSGGNISYNSAANAGGVYNNKNVQFTMNNGSIAHNSAGSGNSGGGV